MCKDQQDYRRQVLQWPPLGNATLLQLEMRTDNTNELLFLLKCITCSHNGREKILEERWEEELARVCVGGRRFRGGGG